MPHVPVIFRGEDKTIEIIITDDQDNPVNLDDAALISVRLLDEARNTIEKYNKDGSGGFRTLDIPVPGDGLMNLFLNAAQTDVAALGFMAAEIKMQFSDPNFEAGTSDAVTTIESLAQVKESETVSDF